MNSRTYAQPVGYHAFGEPQLPLQPMSKTIPFDYVFQFPLKGVRNNQVQDVVEISMEGIFVALSVGYSVVRNEQTQPRTFQPVFDRLTTPQAPVLASVIPPANPSDPDSPNTILVAGTPGAEVVVLLLPVPGTAIPLLPNPPNPPSVLARATIGTDGTVLVPIPFALNTTGIFRIWDRTNNLLSELVEVFPLDTGDGFGRTPVIGPDPNTGKLPAAGDARLHVYGTPGNSIRLFVLRNAISIGEILLNQDVRINPQTGTTTVELQPLGTSLSAGDAVLVDDGQMNTIVSSMFTVPRVRVSTISLGALTAGLEKIGADLTSGFRLNPNFAARALADPPLDQQGTGLDQAFETGAVAAEEASFLYSIDVVSTGRELQNKAIHNIAGLGIANGDRPFRPFAKPMVFEPRSSIRIQVTELSGPPGDLFIVLQGYKMLGTGRLPG